ncbi:DUF4349 domain-containing protein [Nonomuraea phyllanthi]|nr:DUF4349 domain-containing protein [Nonomuraea phyllanthi]
MTTTCALLPATFPSTPPDATAFPGRPASQVGGTTRGRSDRTVIARVKPGRFAGRRKGMRRIRYGIALTFACSALFLAGCGGGSAVESAAREPADAPAMAQGDRPKMRATPQPSKSSREKSPVSNVALTQQDRQVIYTGRLTVRAKQVPAAVQQAKQIVTSAGGHLSKEESNSAGGTKDTATLEFKIPPDKYAGVLVQLGKDLGKQLSMTQGTEDVTMKVADVESRLKSAQESLESLRTLLKKADTIGQVLEVEREISSRESDLESLQAQQKELATQVAMATLTLRLVGPVVAVEEPEEEPAGFLAGLKAGWSALVSFVQVALTVLGAVLPWLGVSLPVVVLVIFLVRRDRARRPRAAVPPRGPGGPNPGATVPPHGPGGPNPGAAMPQRGPGGPDPEAA